MSEVPEGWAWAKLEEIVLSPKQDIVDGPFGSNLKASEYVESGVPIIRLQNVHRNHFIEKNLKFITPEKATELSRHSFHKGDIVITKLGDPLGVACLVPDSLEHGIIVADVVRVRLNEKLALKKFVIFAINSSTVANQLALETKGTTRPRVNLSHIRSLEIPLAPLDEQRRIVAKLEKVLSRVDAAQARLATIPRILKRFRQSVLAAACSGRLTADWREVNTNAESAETYLRKNNPDAVLLENHGIPASWVCCKLENLSGLITKGASPKWQGINYSTTGVLFVTSENVGDGRMLLSTKKYVEAKFNELQKRSILKSGDLLTNIVGASIGRSAIYELQELANINQAVALIRLHEFVDKRYILTVISSPALIEHMHEEKVDVARANLSLKDVADFPIALPPLAEQQEIVRRVEALFKTADAIEARYRTAKAHVDKLTQSILARAFRGELVSTEAELARLEGRDYEPASVLLERIRQERAQEQRRSSKSKIKRMPRRTKDASTKKMSA
jgi:type I restriction enzyme, S subunit